MMVVTTIMIGLVIMILASMTVIDGEVMPVMLVVMMMVTTIMNDGDGDCYDDGSDDVCGHGGQHDSERGRQ